MEASTFTLIRRGKPQELWDALEAGADPEGLDSDRFTPLAIAAKERNLAAMLSLLHFGANINRVVDGRTALWETDHDATRLRLLKLGADPNADTCSGQPLAVSLAKADDVATVRRLIDHGADPDSRLNTGESVSTWLHRRESEPTWTGDECVQRLSKDRSISPEQFVLRSLPFLQGLDQLFCQDAANAAWASRVSKLLRDPFERESALQSILSPEEFATQVPELKRSQYRYRLAQSKSRDIEQFIRDRFPEYEDPALR